ncbi:MAG: FKBP-type peptidyl-prolyl cis-trans isomerase [Muribaculaceae bacterium]|nr:FKBP-type peptidyl-prolyl cis-trans isomerase [Muribaculaceae bacterium]
MSISKLTAIAALLALSAPIFTACNDDDSSKTDANYAAWNKANQAWLDEQQNRLDENGKAYYKKVVPTWNSSAYVLIHQFNDPEETKDNLVPLLTSTVDVRYRVTLYDGTPIDSSSTITSPVPGALRTQLNSSGLISGWKIALTHMHVGDTCEIIIPYAQAYGITGLNTVKPYSNLVFNMRLLDIPYYEVKP